jgi:hypothetical protein
MRSEKSSLTTYHLSSPITDFLLQTHGGAQENVIKTSSMNRLRQKKSWPTSPESVTYRRGRKKTPCKQQCLSLEHTERERERETHTHTTCFPPPMKKSCRRKGISESRSGTWTIIASLGRRFRATNSSASYHSTSLPASFHHHKHHRNYQEFRRF